MIGKKSIIFIIVVGMYFLPLLSTEPLQVCYKKIGDNLVDIRKKYPDIQTKIYTVLDQVDKIYKSARESLDAAATLKKKEQDREAAIQEIVKSKDQETSSLQHELLALKSVLETTQHKLEVATSKLKVEKEYSSKLTKELSQLAQQQEKKVLLEQENAGKDLATAAKEPASQVKGTPEKVVAENVHQQKNNQSLSLNSNSAPNSPR